MASVLSREGTARLDGPRACREAEFDDVISLINSVFRAGTDQDIRTDYPLIFGTPTLEYHRVLSVDGEIAAHVPVAPREVVAGADRFVIGLIGPTVTHPEHRRRGYATQCLRDVVRIQEEHGWPVSVLWTLEATFPFYQQSGWEAVAPQGRVYRLGSRDAHLFEPGPFDVAPYDATSDRDLDTIASIHDAEPQRILRSRQDHRALLSLPKISTYLAMDGEEPVAYLVIGGGVNKPGLIEGGGDKRGLEALVGWTLRRQEPGEEVQVPVPLTPSGLGRLMEARAPTGRGPVEEADGVGYQMMRVNGLEILMRQIGGYLRSKSNGLRTDLTLRCSDSGEAVCLSFRDGDVGVSPGGSAGEVVLTRCQLAQLVFGPHRAATPLKLEGEAGEVLRTVFPFYFPIWALDHC